VSTAKVNTLDFISVIETGSMQLAEVRCKEDAGFEKKLGFYHAEEFRAP